LYDSVGSNRQKPCLILGFAPRTHERQALPVAYFVYILASKRNGTLYVGVTSDLARRAAEHRAGEVAGFTAKYGVKLLVHYEEFGEVRDAIQREKNLKRWNRAWKIKLIEERNPLWREALHILDKDIGTTADIDDAIVYSAGMRWAIMGSFMTYHLAGGPGGMRHFIAQFDPTIDYPWTDLKFPRWNKALETRLVEGCEAQAAGKSVAAWDAKRNAVLVDMMQLFAKHDIASGTVLKRDHKRLKKEAKV
jgi:predicted GIY-YIG superfamily endonuclease